MTSVVHVIEWVRAGAPARLLVAGNDWLVAGLERELLGVKAPLDTDERCTTLVAERGCLHMTSDEQLRQIDELILVDPEDRERWRLMNIKAGRSLARVSTLPSQAAMGAAEHAMLLILALTRTLLPDYSALVGGNWTSVASGPVLQGKTLGIIGLGRSGQALAQRAIGFGMRVIFNDIVAKDEAQARLRIESRRFDQILRESDVISLHLPANADTFRLIDAPELAAMKASSVLINVSDGRLIDEGSLIKTLRRGDIAGAGLDTFAYQPLPADSPLIGFETVVLTPRTAWMSEADERTNWIHDIAHRLSGAP